MKRLARRLRRQRFPGSADYWEQRYQSGGTSGAGSYGDMADTKARIMNSFIQKYSVQDLIEYGCGDGNQLAQLRVPSYIGLDVAPTAVQLCIERFHEDTSKSFFVYHPEAQCDNHGLFQADCTLSQEVIFHLVEDNIFERYMADLFGSANRLVMICSSDIDWRAGDHERHRPFTEWVAAHHPNWRLIERIPSPYPFDRKTGTGMLSDFFVYQLAADLGTDSPRR